MSSVRRVTLATSVAPTLRPVTLATSVPPAAAFPLHVGRAFVDGGAFTGVCHESRASEMSEEKARRRERKRESVARSRERTMRIIESLTQENADIKRKVAEMESYEPGRKRDVVRLEVCATEAGNVGLCSGEKKGGKKGSVKSRKKEMERTDFLEEECGDKESRRRRKNQESSARAREKVKKRMESLEEENTEMRRKVNKLDTLEEEASEMKRKISILERQNASLQEELFELSFMKQEEFDI